jgi:hypothetical protein
MWWNRDVLYILVLSHVPFSENRLPPVGSKPEGMLFRDMLSASGTMVLVDPGDPVPLFQ